MRYLSLLCLLSLTTTVSAQVPAYDHTVMLILENRAASSIYGSAQAPYINSLLSQGASFTQSFGVTHPSQPNYIALFSGSTQGVTSNTTPANLPFTTTNLGAQLFQAGKTFTGYSEGLPSVGYTGDSWGGSPGYWRKHNPWVNWQQIGAGPHPANTMPASVNQPFTSFPSDFSTLPTMSIVVPTQANDMHDGTIAQGDAWTLSNLDNYVQWAKTHNSLFILTFDEDDGTAGNRIATIFVGEHVLPGISSNQNISHYNLLGTLQDMYGLSRNDNTVGVPAITGIFAVPEPTTLVLSGGLAICGLGLWWIRRRSAEKLLSEIEYR